MWNKNEGMHKNYHLENGCVASLFLSLILCNTKDLRNLKNRIKQIK